MTPEALSQYLHQVEGQRLEYKKAANHVPRDMYETVSAFSNKEGGIILLGVNDDGEVTGIPATDSARFITNITTALCSPDCIQPPLYLTPTIVTHPNGQVLVLQVPASSQVHTYAGRVYIREGESDLDITNNQVRVGELYFQKSQYFTESTIYPHLRMEDLDPALFEKARQLIRNTRRDHPWLSVDNEQLLREAVLWRRDFNTGQEGLTLAAALIFGKDSTIQNLLPAYKVEAMVRIQQTDRWDDRLTPPLRTNLLDTYQALKAFVNKHLPEKFHLEGDQRIDLRDVLFREVIGNIIVHREYQNAIATELIIYQDKVVCTNPCKPIFHGPIDPKGFNPYPKNPNIRKFFSACGYTDEIGSGIRNTVKYLPKYANGAKPLFVEQNTFLTELPLVHVHLGQWAEKVQQWLGLHPSCLPHLQEGLAEVGLDPALDGTSWTKLLDHLVPSWRQNGTELNVLNWPQKGRFADSQSETVPSSSENGTELLGKRPCYHLGILALTAKPAGLQELLGFFAYENKSTFRSNYLIPLRQAALIRFTKPDKLNDPDNKYVLTEQGRKFLSGQ